VVHVWLWNEFCQLLDHLSPVHEERLAQHHKLMQNILLGAPTTQKRQELPTFS
jgi:hypothetical protein